MDTRADPRGSPSLIWVQVPPDSDEYARYEAAERAAHEATRAACGTPPRPSSALLGLDHVRDTALINARRPSSGGAGLYLFPTQAAHEASAVFKGWMSEADAMVWLSDHYPWTCETAAACMATCVGERSLCACGVIDPVAVTVRFYAVPALPRRRQKRRSARNQHHQK